MDLLMIHQSIFFFFEFFFFFFFFFSNKIPLGQVNSKKRKKKLGLNTLMIMEEECQLLDQKVSGN